MSGLLGEGARLGEDDGEGAGLDDTPGEPLSDVRPELGKPPGGAPLPAGTRPIPTPPDMTS